MAEAANARAHEIVRLERIAELVTQRIRTNRPTPADLLEAIENELDKRLEDAIGGDKREQSLHIESD